MLFTKLKVYCKGFKLYIVIFMDIFIQKIIRDNQIIVAIKLTTATKLALKGDAKLARKIWNYEIGFEMCTYQNILIMNRIETKL